MHTPDVGDTTTCPDEDCGAEAVCIAKYDVESVPGPYTVHWRTLCVRHHVYTQYL